jgi:hypothetical protein
MLDEVRRHLAQVCTAEDQLRGLLDEALAARRALDRRWVDRLDRFVHGDGAAALDVLDRLAAVDVRLLTAAATAQTRAGAA